MVLQNERDDSTVKRDGTLIFNHEDDINPKYIGIQCRARDKLTPTRLGLRKGRYGSLLASTNPTNGLTVLLCLRPPPSYCLP